MNVETIMTRHVVTVRMDEELHVIRELFDRYRFHHVVVVDKCRVVGVISDRDLLQRQPVHWQGERANDGHHPSAPSAPGDDARAGIRHARNQDRGRRLAAAQQQISCLPVLDANGACVGIVTMRDLLRWSLKQMADQTCVDELRLGDGASGAAIAA